MAGAADTVTLGELPKALAAIGTPPEDYAGLIRQYLVLIGAEAKRAFDEGRSPSGVPWAPLKRQRNRKRDRDRRSKKARGGSGQKLLRDSGILMMSVTGKGAGHVEQLGPSGLTYGTTVPYASFHQGGTKWVPARPFLGLPPRVLELMAQMAADFVAKQLARRAVRKG